MQSVCPQRLRSYKRLRLLTLLAVIAAIMYVQPAFAIEPCHQEFPFKIYFPTIFMLPLSGQAAAQSTSWSGTKAAVDFNGDGCADTAVGIPNKTWTSIIAGDTPITLVVAEAGAINVIYGDKEDFISADRQLFYQNDFGGFNEAHEHFGNVLAAGDFDGDGYSDLAVGTPSETVDSTTNAGVVHVMYGSSSGLSRARVQAWTQDHPDVPDQSEQDDLFGAALASGDFNHDNYADLAIGAPGETVNSAENAGDVTILYGSATGLTATGSQLLLQDQPEVNDLFGVALAANDFNGDTYADLAVGVSGESTSTLIKAGAVTVVFGAASGLAVQPAFQRTLYQDDAGGVSATADYWGTAMASGDLDGDGYADLAVGAPQETISGKVAAGAVNVLHGSASGLDSASAEQWQQGAGGLGDTAEANDYFGLSLTIGYFNNDPYADLVIGAPQEDIDSATDAGLIHVLYSNANGISTTGARAYNQNDFGLTAESGDQFGFALLADDFNRDGYDDIFVSAPYEDNGATQDSGVVNAKLGSATGLIDTVRIFTELLPPEEGTLYGWQLAGAIQTLLTADGR